MKTRSGRDLYLARKKVHLAGARVQGCTFKSNLWANLPRDILEEILAKLPFSSLICLCSLCKRWKELILSSKVFPRRSSNHGRLCYFSDDKLRICSSNKGTWKVVLNFLPSIGRKYLVMSAGGLLCFSASQNAEFIVCNPLTQCYKKLQMPWRDASPTGNQACMPTPNQEIPAILGISMLMGMVPSCNTGHFKLIVGGFFEGSQGTTLVYDSQADSWKKASIISYSVFIICRLYTSLRSRNCERPQPTACGGDLYFFFKDVFPYSQGLLKYDVENDSWSSIDTPRRLGYPHALNIIEHREKLVLVTMSMDSNKMHFLEAFEHQEGESNSWVHTHHLDISGLNGFYSHFTCVEDCLGQGDEYHLSARCRFRLWFRNSDIVSNWKDYPTHYNETCLVPSKVFIPSTILFK